MNKQLYFITYSSDSDKDSLRVSDGTVEGTKKLYEYDYIDNLTVMNKQLYFYAHDFGSMKNLWVSNGTEAGTQVLLANKAVSNFRILNGQLYFTAWDIESYASYDLWVSNGTVGNGALTRLSLGSVLGPLGAIQGEAYFINNDSSALYKTDGSPDDTDQTKAKIIEVAKLLPL